MRGVAGYDIDAGREEVDSDMRERGEKEKCIYRFEL